MPISDFLAGLTYNQQSITDFKDPTSGGMTTLNTPFMFGKLIQSQTAPGGLLSPVTASQGFSGQVQALINQYQAGQSERLSALQQSGLSGPAAMSIIAEMPEQALSQVPYLFAQAQQQLAENTFGAGQALANATASAASQQKQMQLDWTMFQEALKEQKKANKWNKITGLVGGIGGLLGGLAGGIGSLMGGMAAQKMASQFQPQTWTGGGAGMGSPLGNPYGVGY